MLSVIFFCQNSERKCIYQYFALLIVLYGTVYFEAMICLRINIKFMGTGFYYFY